MPEQVQDFYPTPSTMSTVMYYTGIDPHTMKSVYVCRNPHEKALQRALIQYRNPKNYELVKEALIAANRTDLIGFDKKCLIRPRNFTSNQQNMDKNQKSGNTYNKSTKFSGKDTKNTKKSNNKNGKQNKQTSRNSSKTKNTSFGKTTKKPR